MVTCVSCVAPMSVVAHECALVCAWFCELSFALTGSSAPGDGGASFLGGMRSLIASKPFASAKLVILWFGENPCNAVKQTCHSNVLSTNTYFSITLPFFKLVFPPDNAPKGKAPVGVSPLSCSTDSLSSLKHYIQT